jgi:hypothetical protein
MPKIHTENFLISIHTMVGSKNLPKQILNSTQLAELAEFVENYIRELPLQLNGIAVEIDPVNTDTE